jgi:hypothetical protein
MVTFEVGEGSQKETFLIHKEVACLGSAVFETAFNGGFKEGLTQTYELEDIDPNVFRFFSKWLYSQKLTLLDHSFDNKGSWSVTEAESHNDKCSDQDMILVGLWILGDRFAVKGLQNYVMEKIVTVAKVCGPMVTSFYLRIYRGTSKGSQLRRLAVDQCVWNRTVPFLGDEVWFPSEMMIDMLDVYRQAAPQNVKNRKAAALMAEDYFVADM